MLLFLLLLGIVGPHCTSARESFDSLRWKIRRTHSMKYFLTASSGVPNLPEFVMMLLVDEVQITHYDSNTKRAEPKQDWMKRITAEDPQYWETQSQFFLGTQQGYTVDIETVKQTLNQTGGNEAVSHHSFTATSLLLSERTEQEPLTLRTC
ncbi:hypothetical protein F7725_024636 [Dissostichus mawsoni]|uniref:MHC class I-like antigen recognition-like domain-containing protein n=1 Tax=Dissostichus mawsoni TaxID=36200 RepID=A0A7J5X8X9_DISMA|nr:hypothetical protein F7725_024636 [Dissostichus mawsoni]